jgi:hypothetical protein
LGWRSSHPPEPTLTPSIRLAAPIPIFRIFDEAKAREFYVDFLDVRVDWEHRFEEGTPSPFVPFIGYTVALSVLLALLAERTGGSVVIATLFHGAVNTLGLVNTAATPELRGWGNAAGYGLVASVAGSAAWGRMRTPRVASASGA